MKWFRSKTFWGGIAAIAAGVVHIVAEVKTNGIGPVLVGIVSGQYTETVTAIGAGLGLIGVRHAVAKATPTGPSPTLETPTKAEEAAPKPRARRKAPG